MFPPNFIYTNANIVRKRDTVESSKNNMQIPLALNALMKSFSNYD